MKSYIEDLGSGDSIISTSLGARIGKNSRRSRERSENIARRLIRVTEGAVLSPRGIASGMRRQRAAGKGRRDILDEPAWESYQYGHRITRTVRDAHTDRSIG